MNCRQMDRYDRPTLSETSMTRFVPTAIRFRLNNAPVTHVRRQPALPPYFLTVSVTG